MLAMSLAAGALGAAAPGIGMAQEAWPSRPVTMVVPFGPGASNDLFTRTLADSLSKSYNQPFVVENRPGAGGFSGTNAVSLAEPDGYTLLEVPNSLMSFGPLMGANIDPFEALTPLGLLARAPVVMVVPAGLPVNSVQEFIDYAKASPEPVFYGMTGPGTPPQQHAELFAQKTGIQLSGVSYASSADAQTDLVAGRLQLLFVTVASVRGQIEAGQLRLLAYSDDNSPEGVPPGPTLAEEGVHGMEVAQIFWALYGPKGMSPELQETINAAVNNAIQEPGFVEIAARSGASPAPGTPEDHLAAMKAEAAVIEQFLATVPQE